MDKIEAVKKRAAKLYSEGVHPNAIYHEIEELIKQHSLDVKAWKIIDEIRVRREIQMEAPEPPKQAPNSQDPEDDELRPADRQDMIQNYLDNYPDKVFRRQDIQEEFGFSKDQTQKDLRALKKAGRIGYQETNTHEVNPKYSRETQWRKDAVYFSVKDRDPEPTLPVTLKTMDDVRAFIDKWKHLAT
jgi:hypothetical protein